MGTLSSILGQSQPISVLRAAFTADRLPHALLFAGPEGVGKGTTAEALGKLFLCENPRTSTQVDACGTCSSCLLMDGGTHPDYHRIYRQLVRHLKKDSVARDLSTDVIREFLIGPASRSTQQGRGKVFIIEEAELMNSTAQNALLKTLEEPSGRTLIILLTSTPGALLPTIRSRCQPVYFSPLPTDLVRNHLLQNGFSEDLAKDAARMTDGSLGLALRFANDGLVPVAKELETRLISALSGKGTGDLPKFLKESGDKVSEKVMDRDPDGSKDQATREALALLFRLGSESCRRIMRLAKTAAGMEKLCKAVDHLTAAQELIESNVNVALVLQQLSAKLEN